MGTGIVDGSTVDGEVVVVEARIHRTVGSTCPDTVLVLTEHGAATTAQTQADDDRLGIGSLDAEASIAFRVDLRILLTRLVHLVGNEVLLRHALVEDGVEVADSAVAGLRAIVLVEGQRMVVDTQPRVLVAEVPEGHVVDDVGMLAEHLEQTGILVGLKRRHVSGHGLSLATREHQLTAALVVHTEVEFGNVDMLYQLLEADDGLLQLILIGEVDVVVALHADTVDGYASVLHLLHHIIDTLALAVVNAAVVVVEQQGVGVGLTCKLESLGNELIATELEVTALTIWAWLLTRASETEAAATVVGHCLVHHVPGIDHVLVAVYHGEDVLTKTLVEHFLLHGLSLLVGKLRVPAQAMAAHLDTVLTAEVGNLVGTLEVPDTLLRMNLTGLPVVLSRYAVELLLHESFLSLVADVALVKCNTNGEILFVGIFQTYVSPWVDLTPLCPNCCGACHGKRHQRHFH